MSASSLLYDIVRFGINNHMSHLNDRPLNAAVDINQAGKIPLQPKELLFNVNTIKKAVKPEGLVQRLRAKHKPNDMRLLVKTLSGKLITLNLNADYKVEEVKILIYQQERVPLAEQSLRCLSCPEYGMEDGRTLKDYNLIDGSCIQMAPLMRGGSFIAYELEKKSFAPEWHCDFRKTTVDDYRFSRGGFPYIRPHGSYRYALNVLGKYGDDDWLGIQKNRHNENGSLKTEWPVAYHGTTDPRAAEIIRSGGFDLEKGVRFKYGHGIYCTPDPKTALAYATSFKYQGNHYKLILQARVDPARRVVVPKSKHGVADLDDYWIAKENDAIRPYGICVYPC